MKVSVISSSMWEARRASIYGSETQNFLLAEELGKNGYDVHLFAASGSEKSPYFKLHYIPKKYGSLYFELESYPIKYYSDILKDSDIIIDASATNLVAEWAYLRDKKFIIYRNGTGVTARIFKYHNTVVLSNRAKSMIPYPTEVIPYGIDENFYDPNKEESGENFILYLSRPHPSKGLGVFIKIAGMFPDEKFVVSVPMVTAEQIAYSSKYLVDVPNNVEVIPANSDINGLVKRKLYAHSKCLFLPLSPDYVEAFGLVFAEQMAMNKPVRTKRNL